MSIEQKRQEVRSFAERSEMSNVIERQLSVLKLSTDSDIQFALARLPTTTLVLLQSNLIALTRQIRVDHDKREEMQKGAA